MLRKLIIIVTVSMMLSMLPPRLSHSDTAEVLPKGITRIELKSFFYFPIDSRYNDNGDTEDIATDFNSNLNSTIFPDLALIESAFGMPAGSGTVGNSEVSMEFDVYEIEVEANYGLTDKLSLGIKIPYRDIKNDVSAKVNASNATIGFNPQFGQPGDPFGVPLIPVALGGVQDDTLATDLVQNFLVQDYGFKRVESWSDSGLLDVEAGFRYQYLKTDNWRLAFTGGVRFPTGETDDPDNLMDYPFGSGTYALLFYSNNDYIGTKNLLLNATFKYHLYLPDHEVLRVPDDVNQPITPNKEEVDRDLGDIFEFYTLAAYEFAKGFRGLLQYEFTHKFKDDISGDMGFAYDQLEAESDTTGHVVKVGLMYSTLPLYLEKKFPIPLDFIVRYRNRFAGKNVLKSEYIGANIAIHF